MTTTTMRRYRQIDNDDPKLVYDVTFSKQEINMILEALDHHYNNKEPLSDELQDIVSRLVWCFKHTPGRKPEV